MTKFVSPRSRWYVLCICLLVLEDPTEAKSIHEDVQSQMRIRYAWPVEIRSCQAFTIEGTLSIGPSGRTVDNCFDMVSDYHINHFVSHSLFCHLWGAQL